MDRFKAWLFGSPEGSVVKIITTGLIGVALSEIALGHVSPLAVLLAPAVLVPILNYLSTDFTQYGKGS